VNSVQNLAAGTDPHVLANGNPLLRQALRIHRSIDSGQTVICRKNNRMRTDHRVPADREPSMSVKDTVRADVSVRPYLDDAAIGGNDDAVRNSNPSRDQNAPPEHAAIGIDLDHRAPGDVGGAIDLDP